MASAVEANLSLLQVNNIVKDFLPEENVYSKTNPDICQAGPSNSSTKSQKIYNKISENTTQNSGKKRSNTKNITNSSTCKKSIKQNDIRSLFSSSINKRKSEEPASRIDEKENIDKKCKVNDFQIEPPTPIEGLKKILQKPSLQRCNFCRQFLDSPDLVLFPGDPKDSVEEFIALTDPKLSLFTGTEEEINEADERPQHKITDFIVYDKSTHLCSFDSGLIEKNVELYFSGYIKPIYEDNSSIEGGICTRNIGPINEWWTTGYDGGRLAVIGFSTAFADYYLMRPNELYVPFMNETMEKIQISKIVIETLLDNPDCDYEDLLHNIQLAVPIYNTTIAFTEESLIRYSQFVIDQIQSYDSSSDDSDELPLIVAPSVRSLIDLAGVSLGKQKFKSLKNKSVIKKHPKAVESKATVTPLVRSVFDCFFSDQMTSVKTTTTKRRRCGVCEACQQPDCGKCHACADMIKFGGSGRSKQACVTRRCANMLTKDEEEITAHDEDDYGDEAKPVVHKKCHKFKNQAIKEISVTWLDIAILKTDINVFYRKCKVNNEEFLIGDFVCVKSADPSMPLYICQIKYFFETVKMEKKFHARWLHRGNETILGETCNPCELFLVDDCEDVLLEHVTHKVNICFKSIPDDWKLIGGEEVNEHDMTATDNGKDYYYQKRYDSEKVRYEDANPKDLIIDEQLLINNELIMVCDSCRALESKRLYDTPILSNMINEEENKKSEKFGKNKINFECLEYKNITIKVGNFAYFEPDSFEFKIKPIPIQNMNDKMEQSSVFDEATYPERYRKKEKMNNIEPVEPYRIGRILAIIYNGKISEKYKIEGTLENIQFHIQKFYRPEDTHRGKNGSLSSDMNLLYWSDEKVKVELKYFSGKCNVLFVESDDMIKGMNKDSYFISHPDSFYFVNAYDAESRSFIDAPDEVYKLMHKGKADKGKGKGKGKAKEVNTINEEVIEQIVPLNCLDVFAGCGGLSEGLHQAGIAKPCWAIEFKEIAAKAFKLNNPDCTVFADDCNALLNSVIAGEKVNSKGQKLPLKGEIQLLCGGPPCQGFSGMNRFNHREYSKFKNSKIASYLSYCDFYRPDYFILENVRNFVHFRGGMVLKLTLRCLISIGYQCTFGILQAGNYGVPQTRRRLIIFAAAPGLALPSYPEPLHVFSRRGTQLTCTINGEKYAPCISRMNSAPLRAITVRDAMSDLPEIVSSSKSDEMQYGGDALTHFQRLIRLNGANYVDILRDHVCKDMSSINIARIRHIPTYPGSDWRDLPNIEVRLNDGTKSRLLRYTHHDKVNGRAVNGAMRGVCSCSEGADCDVSFKQNETLIPWCLPHTGNRHNQWAGLYGRLDWDGIFSTTVTNPEPMGKQGRVLHPDQHRVVSVRECARSQGFPDYYRFFGSVLDRYEQVGNAVPPPLARAIGLEIKKCLITNKLLQN